MHRNRDQSPDQETSDASAAHIQKAHALEHAPTVRSDESPPTLTAPGETPRLPYPGLAEPSALPSLPALKPGTRLKHYEIVRKLGAGGMGAVFLARDTRLERPVAIKFLLNYSGVAAHRFLAEARITAQCRHENIVVIYDVDEHDGHPYMVLEYIEGRTLRHVMAEQGAVDAGRAVELMLPVARALVRAQEAGLVHRDLKPENILVSNAGEVKVLDFGVAKQAFSGVTEPSAMTQEGALVGTAPYMSPEQLRGEAADARADVWAAGIILFELLTGEHPTKPATLPNLFAMASSPDPMPSVSSRRPDAGPVADIVDHCLKKRKEDRLGSAAELALALERLGGDASSPKRAGDRPSREPAGARVEASPERPERRARAVEEEAEAPPPRRKRSWVVVAGLWILSVVVALLLVKLLVPAHGRLSFGFEFTPTSPAASSSDPAASTTAASSAPAASTTAASSAPAQGAPAPP